MRTVADAERLDNGSVRSRVARAVLLQLRQHNTDSARQVCGKALLTCSMRPLAQPKQTTTFCSSLEFLMISIACECFQPKKRRRFNWQECTKSDPRNASSARGRPEELRSSGSSFQVPGAQATMQI